MNYPYGPYGQGLPGQPGQPQQPGYPQQPDYLQQAGHPQQGGYPQQPGFPPPGYPQQGGFPQPYGYPAAEPSGTTGTIAAVLAALGGVAGLVGGAFGAIGLAALSGMSSSDVSGGVYALLVVVILFNFVFGLMIATGAVMLFQRKMLGRWLVVGASALAILSSLISFGVGAAAASAYGSYSTGGGGGVLQLLGLVFPVATIVLALLPSTTAWINAKPSPVAPQFFPPMPQQYPPYQG